MARILISADMEGVAGVTNARQTRRGTDEFPEACRLMTAEVAAACEGAIKAGATEIIVNDSHGDMRNINPEGLPKMVQLLRGDTKPWGMVQGIDEAIDAIAFLGYHAPANSVAGILDHTYAGGVIQDVLLNGEPCSEGRMNAAIVGSFGVPAVFLSGDQTTCADIRRFLPWIHVAEVKKAIGSTVALAPSPTVARERISVGMEAAVRAISAGVFKPYVLDSPLRLDITLRSTEMADEVAVLPEVERLSGTMVRIEQPDVRLTHRYFRVIRAIARDAVS